MELIEIFKNQYVEAAIIFLLFVVIGKIIAVVLRKYLKKITDRTKTKFDDILLEKTEPFLTYVIILVGVKVVLLHIGIMTLLLSRIINSFITILAVYFAIIIIEMFINFWGINWAKRTKSGVDAMLPLVHQLSKVVLIITCLMFILNIWDKDITGLLAGVGIAGIVLGFALKDSLSNIFGGISIILDKTYRVGDRIKIGDPGESGIVYDISLRSTRIKTWDNDVIIIPNGMMANSKIQNYVQPSIKSRGVIEFCVAYGSDVDKVKKVIIEAIKKVENVLDEPAPSVYFSKMNDFSLDFNAKFWVDDIAKRYETQENATIIIYKTLKKEGISIPFPTRTVYLKK
ncbi:MAG: mechanosensitive ion channel family protein [Nanoarchaeota archaeon]|nr:mechanosensitive ion channel family protein [Nanoarchaeota archaeon]